MLGGRSSEVGASMSAPSSQLPAPSLVIIFFILSFCFCSESRAESKNWNAEGDGTGWFDDANWLPAGKPTASDEAKIDLRDAQVDIEQSYEAQSLTIGGKKNSDVSVSNFVTGTLEPSDASNNAMLVRRDGKITLKGSAGKIKLKGIYKDSEEIIPDEPSFMLYVK